MRHFPIYTGLLGLDLTTREWCFLGATNQPTRCENG